MKRPILIFFLCFATMVLLAQTVSVTYGGGTFTPSLPAGNSVDRLNVVSATATDYLTLATCQQIKTQFKTGKGAGKLILDLSGAVFKDDSIPHSTSEANASFAAMTSLKEVVLPGTLKTIGGYAFKNCTNLTTINFPATLKKVMLHAFARSSGATTLIISGLANTQLEVAGDYAFYNNTSTSNPPTLPNTIKNVGQNAFANTAVNVLEFAEGATTIGSGAFNCGASAGRQKITTLTFPSTLTGLAGSAFANQPNISTITFKSQEPPFAVDVNPFPAIAAPASVTVYVPCETSVNYQTCTALSGMTIVEIPCDDDGDDDDPEPGELIITHNTTGGMEVEIAAALGSVSATSVNKLTIKGVANLSYDDCRAVVAAFPTTDLKTLKLTNASFEHNKIPAHASVGAFQDFQVETVVLPTYLEIIGQRAFKSCTKLTNVQFSIALQTIELGAFTGCSNLNIITLPSTLKTIESYVFQNCSKLTLSELPNGLEGAIGAFSFNNTKVTIASIPCAVTSIGNSAFAGVSTFTQISFSDGIASLGTKAFAGTNLNNITVHGDYPPSSNTSTDGNHSFGTLSLTGITLHIPPGTIDNFGFAPWNQMIIIEDAPVETGCVNPRTVTVNYGGRQRTYLLYLPDNYTSTMSADGIIVSCHGFGGLASNALARFQSIANNSSVNMICIAPQALPEEDAGIQSKSSMLGNAFSLDACWGQVLHAKVSLIGLDNTFNDNIDDISFIRHIIQTTAARYNANQNNVFIGGISMGGYMAYAYAMRYGNELAGIINYSGNMGYHLDTLHVVGSQIETAILDFHSKTDATVFYEGEGTYSGLVSMKNGFPKLKVLDFYARKNGIAVPLQITDLGTNSSGVSVKKYYYDHAKYDITHYQLDGENATHSYVLTSPVNHSTEVRNFILQHKTDNSMTKLKEKERKSVSIYPAVVKNELNISGLITSQQVRIYSLTGIQVATAFLRAEHLQSISVEHLADGIYFLRTKEETLKFVKK